MMVSSEIVLVKEFYCSPNPVLKRDEMPQILLKSTEPVKHDGRAEESSKGHQMPECIDICSSTESEEKLKKPSHPPTISKFHFIICKVAKKSVT